MEPNVELITIGDEILIGQIVDTNSAWMAAELNKIGLGVSQITTISDRKDQICSTFDEAFARADVILVTGGLGPTKDDITRTTLAEYFESALVLNDEVWASIQARLKMRNIPETVLTKGQAMVPEGCTAFVNERGTAPGMWFEKEGKILVSMPGVPSEMKGLMRKSVLPALQQRFTLPAIEHRTILTYGTYEAHLAGMLEGFEASLPDYIKLAYLPSQGRVRLRLTGRDSAQERLSAVMDDTAKELMAIVGKYVFGKDEETLEQVTGALLREYGKSVVTAESCTGGLIAHLITSVPGASDYFLGSIVAYSNDIKINELGVKPETIRHHGAVSREAVTEMALGVKKRLHADYALAVSGIAGPDGGTPDKPVGTIWLALASPEEVTTQLLKLPFERLENISRTAYTAINMLRKSLLKG